MATTSSATTRSLYINTIVFAMIAGILSIVLLVVLLYAPAFRTYVWGIATLEIGLVAIIVAAIIRVNRYEADIRKSAERGNAYLVSIDTCPDYFTNKYQARNPPAARPTGISSRYLTPSSYVVPTTISTEAALEAAAVAAERTASAAESAATTPALMAVATEARATATAARAAVVEVTKQAKLAGMNGVLCRNGYTTPSGDKTFYFVKKGCSGSYDDASCAIDPSVPNDRYVFQLNDFNNITSTEICNRVNTRSANSSFTHIPWTDVKGRCNSLSLGEILA